MYSELEKKMTEKALNSRGVNIAINSNGDFLMFPKGKGEDINYYYEGNLNSVDKQELSANLLNFMRISLDRDNLEIDLDKEDKFRLFETAEYKKDKCKSMKLITINVSRMYPEKVLLVDMVNVAKFEWGGGRYMHFLPIEAKCSEIIDLLKKVYEYDGHMPGATNEQKNLYRKK